MYILRWYTDTDNVHNGETSYNGETSATRLIKYQYLKHTSSDTNVISGYEEGNTLGHTLIKKKLKQLLIFCFYSPTCFCTKVCYYWAEFA